MSVVIIINPVAGGRRRSLPPDQRVRLVEQALDRHRLTGRIELTRDACHTQELARAAVAEGCRLVIGWGGDGTLNDIASQLLGIPVALGIVRAGSGNGFARELGIPARADLALDIALGGRERVLDVGEIDGRPFLNVAGVGFDAAMAVEFNRLGSDRRGPLRYALQVARAGFGYPATRYTIEADGHRLVVDALLIAVANLAQYGSNAVIAPTASPDDGLLDVVVIEDRGAFGRICLVPRLFHRTTHIAPGVTVLRAQRVIVSTTRPIAIHVDGEPHLGGNTIEARIHPAALHVKVA